MIPSRASSLLNSQIALINGSRTTSCNTETTTRGRSIDGEGEKRARRVRERERERDVLRQFLRFRIVVVERASALCRKHERRAMRSTHKLTETPASIMRFTALPPPPPHPTTLILAEDAETTTVSFLEDEEEFCFLRFKETPMDLLLEEEIRLLDNDDDLCCCC